MLCKELLQRLRKQIVLNSLYVSDYENDMGISSSDCCNFFDGYVEYLGEIIVEEYGKVPDSEWFDKLGKVDTIENLETWYNCFDTDPLSIILDLEEAA